jgi:hypothetical protein
VIALRRLLNRIHSHLYGSDSTIHPAGPAAPLEGSPSLGESDAFLNGLPTRHLGHALYPPHSLISELDRQLEEWRSCLPPPIQFPQYAPFRMEEPLATVSGSSNISIIERLKSNLMARYFAAKSILNRPFLYQLLHDGESLQLPELEMTGAQIAIDSAFQSFLHNGLLHEDLSILVHPMNTWRR